MNTSSREPAPPVNNALLPDIYSKLDAETIEKTRVLNTVLDIRLDVEQRVIAKYKREAERMLKAQRARAVQDLLRIARKLPSVLAEQRSLPRRCQKGYMSERNEEAICYRCYIHHLPSKKKFYRVEATTPPPPVFGASTKNNDHHSLVEAELGLDNSSSGPVSASQRGDGIWERARTPSRINVKNHSSRVIAPIEKFKFLDRDRYGRERDLNDSLTPRLVPYEDWKTVVKNVCRQCKREIQVVSRSPPLRLSGFSRERAESRSPERSSHRGGKSSTDRNLSIESTPSLSRLNSSQSSDRSRADSGRERRQDKEKTALSHEQEVMTLSNRRGGLQSRNDSQASFSSRGRKVRFE